MPLQLLRGSPRSAKAPVLPPGSNETDLLAAYLTFFERQARRPNCRVEAGLFGPEAGFTPEQALKTAVRAASIYLRGHEADIAILVPETLTLGTDFSSELAAYIANRYTGGGFFGISLNRMPPSSFGAAPSAPRAPERNAGAARFSKARRSKAAPPEAMDSADMLAEAPDSLEDMLKKADAGFSETLLRLIDESGRKDSEVYKAANIDRKLFSKIRSNPQYRPSKPTALALAVALRLDLDEAEDLIGRAGYTLTHASRADIIVEYFIVTGKYDIFEINETLFRYDLPLLGGG